MDREQLFQNLSELEKQLKGIKSATEHVNQVVAADRELVKAVNDFTKEASKLIESTRGNFEVEVKAVQKAAAGGLVNLDDYDANGDGIVDMVYIIYAGLGEADGGDANTVWPHMWNLQASQQFANQTIQGKRLGLYACSAEYRTDPTVTQGKSFSGIGTFCHEYGHCLGLPDIYDVTYSGGYGMGNEWMFS